MHRAFTSRLLRKALRVGEATPLAGIPLFLCPAVVGWPGSLTRTNVSQPSIPRCRATHTEPAVSNGETIAFPEPKDSLQATVRRLPLTCSGCGAFSQSEDPAHLGYFDLERKRIQEWLHPGQRESIRLNEKENQVVDEVLKSMDPEKLKDLGLDPALMLQDHQLALDAANSLTKPPVCERCHNLMHHSTTSDTAKVAMYHPTVESLRETIEESPHKYNHIYHIIDAADFPMSLIPRLNVLLGDIPLRTRNRRSRASKFHKDRKTEMSFIITRSDLLGPTKEMVDAMMPYLRDVLRDALGRLGQRVRLGNVRCVSARRSWWTSAVKEDIWHRGGAGWMVGKVNVGKSQLFEAVYPKGRVDKKDSVPRVTTYPGETIAVESMSEKASLHEEQAWEDTDIGELLPPPQPTQNYPEMPLVSSLPGTTASPIRIPFGNGKGELIDLPGLARSDLELFVKEEHRQSLIMKKRIVPEQVSVKPGKSILLGGGLIRITPRSPDMVFLMYNFTPIPEHLTMTEKAVGFQNQTRQSIGLENITLPGVGDKMKHAGTFQLRYDVTKKRAGPLTRKNAVGLGVDVLPFRVLSVDILIEGVGYVEVVAQIRKREFERLSAAEKSFPRNVGELKGTKPLESKDPFKLMFSMRRDSLNAGTDVTRPLPQDEPAWPAVDVYTPEGRFVSSRMPINGWLNNKPRVLAEHKKSRPRRSMKGAKKLEKKEKRERSSD